MHSVIAAKLPVWKKGDSLDLAKLADVVGAQKKELAKIIDVSEATARSPKVSNETIRKAQPLLYILNMLWKLTDGDEAEIRRWFNDPRVEWAGLTPLNCLLLGKVDAVKRMLERAHSGEISST